MPAMWVFAKPLIRFCSVLFVSAARLAPSSGGLFHCFKDFKEKTTKSKKPGFFCQLPFFLAVGLAVSGCSTSVLLPAWNVDTSSAPAPTSSVDPANQNSPQSEIRPTTVQAPVADSIAAPPQQQSTPYSAAVAARFADPTVRYSTPGLLLEGRGGQKASTSTQSADWLRLQASAALKVPGLKAEVLEIGTSRAGQPLLALVLARTTAGVDAASVKSTNLPTVFLTSPQPSSGEAQAMPGTEALLVLARELSQGLLQPMLERINVLIVPFSSSDMASDSDASQDALLLSTPESQAMARLIRDYQPVVIADAREYAFSSQYLQTLGAVQKFDAQIQYATTANVPEFLTKAAEEWFRRPLLLALNAQNLSAEWMHRLRFDGATVAMGKKMAMGSVQPGNARNAGGLKHAVSLVIESRGGPELGSLHLQRRVHTHVTALTSILASTAQRFSELGQLRAFIDKEAISLACRSEAVVQALPTPVQYELRMLDPVTGADKTLAVDWDSALSLQTVKTRAYPCGYWLSAQSAQAVERLELHGIKVLRLAESSPVLGESYRETSRLERASSPATGLVNAGNSEGPVRVEISLQRSLIDLPRGSYWVPLAQPWGLLAMAALEPDAPNSFFSNRILGSLQDVARVMAEPVIRTLVVP